MTPIAGADPRARAVRDLHRATGQLSTAAMARMDDDMPWFAELSAEDRSWVGVIVQAGIKSFVDWYADEVRHPELDGTAVAAQVFGAAPRALAGVISLQQTVDLVRLGIEVVESNLDAVLDPDDARDVHAGVLRYGREVAFATAEVYARAAEVRGAWDARLEALVVDSVLRAEADETMLSRASALGWGDRGAVAVVLGSVPPDRRSGDLSTKYDASPGPPASTRCAPARETAWWCSWAASDDPEKAAARVLGVLRSRTGRSWSARPSTTSARPRSARGALSAHRAATGWPEAPRPVRADDLLPERALAGDGHARRHLVEEVFLPLVERPRHPRRDARDLLRPGPLARGHRARAVLPPQHRALPAAPGRRPHRTHPHRRPRRLHPRDRARPRPAVGARVTRIQERYLRLALRLARLDEGVLDSYVGPPEIRRAVDAEARPDASALVGEAEELLAELPEGWLRDQVVGLRTVAGRLAGEQIAYPDEVEACYGVRPALTDRRRARHGVRASSRRCCPVRARSANASAPGTTRRRCRRRRSRP